MMRDSAIRRQESRPAGQTNNVAHDATRQSVKAAHLCPTLLKDVAVWPLFTHDDSQKDLYIVGNREVDRYVSVPAHKLPVVLKILELFDGQHSMESIEIQLYAETHKKVDVRTLYKQLHENGLLLPVSGEIKKGDIERMSVRLVALDVEKIFMAVNMLCGVLFPRFVMMMFLLSAIGTPLAIARWEVFVHLFRNTIGGSLREEAFLYPVLLLLSFLFHEVAHGIVGARYGIFAKRLEAALYLGFIPIVYLRIPGLYTLRPSERIKVWSAGIFWNVSFASFSVALSAWLPLPPAWRDMWLLVALTNYFIALSNLCPFLPTDGYFILSTLLKRHNVRSNAWKELATWAVARKHKFSSIALSYLVGMLSVMGFTLWRNMLWIRQLFARSPFLGSVGVILFMLLWLMCLWKWTGALQTSSREGSQVDKE
jgi:putative peptide zinc metalloprotease protein